MSRPSIQRLSKNRITLFSSTGNLGQSDGRKHEGYFCPQGARFAHSDPARRPRFPPFPPVAPVAKPLGGLWLAGPGQGKPALPEKKRPTCKTLRSPESKLSKAPRRQQKVCPESPADCRYPYRHNHCSLFCPSGRQIDPWGVRADLQGGIPCRRRQITRGWRARPRERGGAGIRGNKGRPSVPRFAPLFFFWPVLPTRPTRL